MNWLGRSRGRASDGSDGDPPIATVPVVPAPDHAWKALSVTNEWIRHADAKTGITLAFVAATATALFNVAHAAEKWTCWLTGAVAGSSVALLSAVASAGLALLPRVALKKPKGGEDQVSSDDAVNLLFFGDVAKHYGSDRPTYRDVLRTLTSDPSGLTGQIADQIHANAHVATTKFRWANRAIRCELIAAVGLAASALLYATGW